MLNFTLLDKSNYLKGLLIIARKDNQLVESERTILKNISKKLGFSSDFYEETINNLLVNQHINEEPIKFSSKDIARLFISDGLKLAFADKKIHGPEIKWLKSINAINELDIDWFVNEFKKIQEEMNSSAEKKHTLYLNN